MYGPFGSLVLSALPWATVFLLAHCVWCCIVGHLRLAIAEFVMGVLGNAVVLGILLQLLGDPVPFNELIAAQFAGIPLTIKLLQSLKGS
jgi:multisubunit Na+/H+ antiporter MnhE subunit